MNIVVLSLLVLCTVSVAIATFVCLYHLSLMFFALFSRSQRRSGAGTRCHSFAIVIPAHDEEATIALTLDSCAALEYPKDKIAIYVIADNCSDHTVEVAAGYGVTCLVRNDEARRGKGYALEWALPQVVADGYDAIVVLDADCEIDARALNVFDAHLDSGERVLQADYVVANPDQNARTYVLALANTLENDCFYAPKSALGMAVLLRGTGMVFHRDVLIQFPWHARSIVEDVEYSCRLLWGGYRICFVPETRVISAFPAARSQLAIQRARWIGGGIRSVAACAPQLVWEGVRTGRVVLFDAVLTMLIASRPLVIAQFVLSLLLAILCWQVSPAAWSAILLACCLVVAAGYIVYAATGVIRLGISRRRIWLLACTPLKVVEYLFVALKSLFRYGTDGWQRTPRTD